MSENYKKQAPKKGGNMTIDEMMEKLESVSKNEEYNLGYDPCDAATEEELAEQGELDSFELNEIRFNSSFLDLLLSAIIQAYPLHPKDKNHEQRLNEAKEALFGIVKKKGNSYGDDTEALRYMAEEYVKDRGGPGISLKPSNPQKPWLPRENVSGARPIETLAKESLHLTSGQSQESTIDRLRRKFRKQKERLIYLAIFQDDLPSSFDAQSLEAIEQILSPYGIKINIPE